MQTAKIFTGNGLHTMIILGGRYNPKTEFLMFEVKT